MRFFIAFLMINVAAWSWKVAGAFPDGAPWGAANLDAERNCATCHFDAEPIRDSRALLIDGLPSRPEPGAMYELKVILRDPTAVVAGFQLVAQAVDQEAGTFVSAAADVEFAGAAIRSITPMRNDTEISWALEWHAPVVIPSSIVFHVAASAANGDGSPFGDIIHFVSYEIAVE